MDSGHYMQAEAGRAAEGLQQKPADMVAKNPETCVSTCVVTRAWGRKPVHRSRLFRSLRGRNPLLNRGLQPARKSLEPGHGDELDSLVAQQANDKLMTLVVG